MSEFEPRVLIEASAGTGKTQALAERMVAMLTRGAAPSEIVALTFSRAAAGEIFQRFVELLANRADGDSVMASLLRKVIATQHLSQIGTLDGFLMRMVRCFPLELGISGDVEIMDEYESARERGRVSFMMLRRTSERLKRAFVDAFAMAMNGVDVRGFAEAYRKFVDSWHERYLAMPDEPSWLALNPPEVVYEEVPNPDLAGFFEWVRSFNGSFDGVKGLTKVLLNKEDVFVGSTIEVSYYRKSYVFSGNEAAAIRAALSHVFTKVLRMRSEMGLGIYRLISAFEREYDTVVRRHGKLVFADVPRFVSSLDDASRLALEYRMDAKVAGWALDEFQDTSREQWKALSNLIDEAKQSDGDKSVFVVGDVKQAIYGWRNGDVRIFARERESGGYASSELNKTYRCGPAIVEALNKVFVDGRLKEEFPAWRSPVHDTAHPGRIGFVQKVSATGGKTTDFVLPVLNALKSVDPVRRGIKAAVLVRNNDLGQLLAEALKREGLAVAWEGDDELLDTPVLGGFLDLVRLSDHPNDTQAYAHFKTTLIARSRFPDGVPPAEELSALASQSFVSVGLVRTFRELRSKLPESAAEAWSEFSEERFADFLRAAAEFELSMSPATRISDFESFMASRRKRNVAAPGVIRVMTIHHSKGLSFDYVVLPLYEHYGIGGKPSQAPLIGDDWILPDPGEFASRMLDKLVEARELRKDRDEQESLCTYYVAMTRARYALTIITHPSSKNSETIRFSDFVQSSLPDAIGVPDWYRQFTVDDGAKDGVEKRRDFAPVRAKRRNVSRRLPSLDFSDGQCAGDLFLSHSALQHALEKGIAIHEQFEKIEWIDANSAANALERELVRPDGFRALWRERPFELLVGEEWISGRFDRVVFADGRARVMDFKTNRKQRGESDEDFGRRMRETYAGQMSAYRRAVAVLAGLPLERVSACLLLVENGSVEEM